MKIPIEVLWADFSHYPASALVNSSNTELFLGSNVSNRFREAAGPELEEAMSAALSRNGGPFPLGSAVPTPSFDAGEPGVTKFIIHAVLLGARNFRPEDGRTLATIESVFIATYNCVKMADELGCDNVLFPIMAARPGYSVLESDPSALRWA